MTSSQPNTTDHLLFFNTNKFTIYHSFNTSLPNSHLSRFIRWKVSLSVLEGSTLAGLPIIVCFIWAIISLTDFSWTLYCS
jgi:hypothetical protein